MPKLKDAIVSTRGRIKSNRKRVVKLLFFSGFFIFPMFLAYFAFSAPPEVVVPKPSEPSDINRNAPDVEVRTFPVTVLKRSMAAGVYLFEDPTAALPGAGKILLLKKEAEPFMALRVLKVYLDKKEFAAKKLRFYHDHSLLNDGDSFTAYEKLADIPLPPMDPQDAAAIDAFEEEDEETEEGSPPLPGSQGEMSGDETLPTPSNGGDEAPPPPEGESQSAEGGGLEQPQAYDPELDAESSPPPVGAVDSVGRGLEEQTELAEGGHTHMMVEDIAPIEPNRYGLTGQLGFFRNINPDDENRSSIYFVGGGMRFSYTLQRMLFIRQATLQDSFGIEGGLFMYKTLLQSTNNNADAYNIFPIVGTARYQVHIGETFTGFIYGGILKNFSIAAQGSSSEKQAILSQFMPAVGIGGLFRLGPSWDIRFDLGIDFVGGGLVLGF